MYYIVFWTELLIWITVLTCWFGNSVLNKSRSNNCVRNTPDTMLEVCFIALTQLCSVPDVIIVFGDAINSFRHVLFTVHRRQCAMNIFCLYFSALAKFSFRWMFECDCRLLRFSYDKHVFMEAIIICDVEIICSRLNLRSNSHTSKSIYV